MKKQIQLRTYFNKTSIFHRIPTYKLYKEGGRNPEITRARCFLSYFLRINLQLEYKPIMKAYGYDNHTTILNHVKNMRDLLTDESIGKKYDEFVSDMLNLDNKSNSVSKEVVLRYLQMRYNKLDRILTNNYAKMLNLSMKDVILNDLMNS